jgi:hypothetical protein
MKECPPNEAPSTTALANSTAKMRPAANPAGYLTKITIRCKNWLGRLRVDITHKRLF